MIRLALSSLRFRTAAFLAIFVAVVLGAALMSAAGGLLETGLRLNAAPQRLADAPIVVTGRPAYHPPNGSGSVAYPERHGVDPALVDKLARTPGVAQGDPGCLVPRSGCPRQGHSDRPRLDLGRAHAVQARQRQHTDCRTGSPRPTSRRYCEARRQGERHRERCAARVHPRRRRHTSAPGRRTVRVLLRSRYAEAGRRDRRLPSTRYFGTRPGPKLSSYRKASRR